MKVMATWHINIVSTRLIRLFNDASISKYHAGVIYTRPLWSTLTFVTATSAIWSFTGARKLYICSRCWHARTQRTLHDAKLARKLAKTKSLRCGGSSQASVTALVRPMRLQNNQYDTDGRRPGVATGGQRHSTRQKVTSGAYLIT